MRTVLDTGLADCAVVQGDELRLSLLLLLLRLQLLGFLLVALLALDFTGLVLFFLVLAVGFGVGLDFVGLLALFFLGAVGDVSWMVGWGSWKLRVDVRVTHFDGLY